MSKNFWDAGIFCLFLKKGKKKKDFIYFNFKKMKKKEKKKPFEKLMESISFLEKSLELIVEKVPIIHQFFLLKH